MYSNIERNLEHDLPTAILFSSIPQIGTGWESLVDHTCGGFSCDSIDGWGLLLPLKVDVAQVVADISDERFCEDCKSKSMDYFGSHDERREQQHAYRTFLGKHGLTISDDNLKALKQAAYPLDATTQNLERLVQEIPDVPLDALVILVLGHNCD